MVADNDGMVLDITKEAQKVTLVEDIKVNKAELKKDIEVKETEIYEKAMNIIKTAETGDLYFKKLSISGNTVSAYIYDGLICKGSYKNLIECMKNGTLKTVVFDLYQKDVESGVINIGSNNYCSFTP